METKTCKSCGRELPLTDYRRVKGGGYGNTCKECCSEALKEAAYQRKIGGGKTPPFSDPDFDGKQPVEVIQLMSRAKRWLEAQGYRITLKGEYTVKKEVKF